MGLGAVRRPQHQGRTRKRAGRCSSFVGDDLYELASEIDKLATWAAGDPLTAADVERLVAARAETSNFALTDAWGARDVAGVLHASEGLLERSGDPRSKTIPRVVGIAHEPCVAKIRRAQLFEAEGIAAATPPSS